MLHSSSAPSLLTKDIIQLAFVHNVGTGNQIVESLFSRRKGCHNKAGEQNDD
jgi:hypothetical protein